MTEKETKEVWSWGIGEKSDNYYDYWAYHKDCEYEIHVWWDKGNNHCAEIIPIKGINQDGDLVYETPKETCEFDTEDEAIEYACDLMEKYT